MPLNLFSSLKKALESRAQRKLAAYELHTAIVHASRRPVFYESFAVPDSLDGRFDLLCLFASLVLRRLRTHDDKLAQNLFDAIFAQLDLNLREMGVGDLGVPKKIKKMAKALYGRMSAYEAGFVLGNEELEQALRRNLYATLTDVGTLHPVIVQSMVLYCRQVADALDSQSLEALQRGQITLPAPATVPDMAPAHAI